ncbi:MAG: hypothetical protein HS106_07570 [Ideonella sp.]|nr:hypothetical protein [Ideonella sp.]
MPTKATLIFNTSPPQVVAPPSQVAVALLVKPLTAAPGDRCIDDASAD